MGSRRVLDNVDLEIQPGEFVALLGQSGSGKSTLLRAIAELDYDVRGAGELHTSQNRSVVFQDARLLPWARVLENVILGVRSPDARALGEAALVEVGLAGRERAWPIELSGGEQQRVALARSLVRAPDLLLADEPFGALDFLTRLRMHELLRELCERHRPAVLLVTHDVDEAIQLADRVLVLVAGQIAVDQRIVLPTPRSHRDRQFLEYRELLLGSLGVLPAKARARSNRRSPTPEKSAMTQRPGKLHLNAFLMSVGHHEAAWRLPESDPFANTSVEHFKGLARTAERGKLDSLFLADSPVLWNNIGRRPAGTLEPTVLLAALAGATEHIGLIATASTTYNEPFNLARRFASLDHLSGGRAGWNIVTTAGVDAARNFNLEELPAHADRYARAAEFVDVSLKLWDSWADDAPLGDKEQGIWGDESKLYAPRHKGRFFKVEGALNVPRSPQGYPLLVQAGSSEDGKALAARYAEAVFTAQQTLEDGRAFYVDLKQRTREAGRDPDTIKILPGIVPVIGATETEALQLDAELDRLIKPEHAKRQLAQTLRVKPEELELDAELPKNIPSEDEIEGAKSRFTLIVNLARRERLTVRQLIGRLGGGRGHRTFAGAPEQVADAIQLWWENGAADGFNIMPPVLPSGLSIFVDQVVPILQRRGLFRTDYEGKTLRENYGLARPGNANLVRSALEGAA